MKSAIDIPVPPDLKRHVIARYDLSRIFRFINEPMLYSGHLGFKSGAGERESGRAAELRDNIENLKSEILRYRWIEPSAVYCFFPAGSLGDSVLLYDAGNPQVIKETFKFPRLQSGGKLCLSDFLAPAGSGKTDYLAMFALTCGPAAAEKSAQLRAGGELSKSHMLDMLSIACAEAFAEALHDDIRRLWGFPDPEGTLPRDKISGKYRGKRFSFGYPACPDLSDQAKLFSLLRPGEIGITLTENFMMSPEASVSALVFHSPAAKHF